MVEPMNISTTTSSVENVNTSFLSLVDDGSRQPRIVFLALFIVTTLVGNSCLIIVIVQNKRYRGKIHNLIILNLCSVNLLDCVLNMPLVFGSLIATNWVYGDVMCRFNTFCMNFVIVETVLTLTALTADRFLAVKIMPSRYGSILSPSRTYIAIAYTWFHSIAFSLPLLAGAVPSTFRIQLHLCSISDSSSLVFVCLTSIVCFVAPVITMIILYVFIFKAAHKERFSVRSKLAEHNYTEKSMGKPQIWKEIDLAKYSGLLLVLWVVFEVPYIVTTYIKQYQYSREFQNNPSIQQIDYPWLVDVTFVWVRFAFSGILPVLTFSWKRDLWRTWKDTILCRRSNSITDSESFAKSVDNKKNNLSIPNVKSKEREQLESPSALTFNVPVLFATANGIHVHTHQGNITDSDIFYAEIPSTARSSSDLKFLKGKKLDVVSPLELAADTSDYDSHSDGETTDPYSKSQPVSTRQIQHSELDKVSRSSSQPEIPERKTSSRLSNIRPFEAKLTALSYGTDSGLDLSGTSRCINSLDKVSVVTKESLLNKEQHDQIIVVTDDKSESVSDTQTSKSKISQEKNSTFVIGNQNDICTNQNLLGETYTQESKETKTVVSRTRQDVNGTTKKPPLHLEPLSDKTDFKQTRRKKAKVTNSGESAISLNKVYQSKPRQDNADTKRTRPGHKRQGTAESQKALLGSASSAELQDLKADLQKMDAKDVAAREKLGGGDDRM